MIIAHLPAGYLMVKALSCRFKPDQSAGLWLCGLVASVLPDIDILWFYLEGGVRNHRYYPTHWPLFWLALFAASVMALLALKKRRAIVYPAITLAGVMLHLLLDLIAAPVFYAAPFSYTEKIQLVRVPALYNWWVMNYVRHWIFQVELMIWGAAVLAFGLSQHEANWRGLKLATEKLRLKKIKPHK